MVKGKNRMNPTVLDYIGDRGVNSWVLLHTYTHTHTHVCTCIHIYVNGYKCT